MTGYDVFIDNGDNMTDNDRQKNIIGTLREKGPMQPPALFAWLGRPRNFTRNVTALRDAGLIENQWSHGRFGAMQHLALATSSK